MQSDYFHEEYCKTQHTSLTTQNFDMQTAALAYQFMSLRELWAAQGWRQRSTTTESALAGIKPRTNTFLTPHE